MFKAQILADSTHGQDRLTTFELEMPRYIWPEMLTHRVFSRNAQSTRAIPVHKMIENLKGDSRVTPILMQNCPGMSPDTPLPSESAVHALDIWDKARREAILSAEILCQLGVHKQVVGRLLEPFSTIKAIVSSTSFDNFFELRLAKEAQQEIQVVARLMKDALDMSKPVRMDIGEWHLPLVSSKEKDMYPVETLKKICSARCARVSYLNHKGEHRIEDDLYLHDRLVENKHASALEHCATPAHGKWGNFRGWYQYRLEAGL